MKAYWHKQLLTLVDSHTTKSVITPISDLGALLKSWTDLYLANHFLKKTGLSTFTTSVMASCQGEKWLEHLHGDFLSQLE